MIANKEETNPASLNKEISILYELGLNPYEIDLLLFLKTKQQLRRRWEID